MFVDEPLSFDEIIERGGEIDLAFIIMYIKSFSDHYYGH